jgi:hypothetical protein
MDKDFYSKVSEEIAKQKKEEKTEEKFYKREDGFRARYKREDMVQHRKKE